MSSLKQLLYINMCFIAHYIICIALWSNCKYFFLNLEILVSKSVSVSNYKKYVYNSKILTLKCRGLHTYNCLVLMFHGFSMLRFIMFIMDMYHDSNMVFLELNNMVHNYHSINIWYHHSIMSLPVPFVFLRAHSKVILTSTTVAIVFLVYLFTTILLLSGTMSLPQYIVRYNY